MFNAPACVDALEERIATSVTHWKEWKRHCVKAKGFSHGGKGFTPEAAVRDFLIRNAIELAHPVETYRGNPL